MSDIKITHIIPITDLLFMTIFEQIDYGVDPPRTTKRVQYIINEFSELRPVSEPLAFSIGLQLYKDHIKQWEKSIAETLKKPFDIRCDVAASSITHAPNLLNSVCRVFGVTLGQMAEATVSLLNQPEGVIFLQHALVTLMEKVYFIDNDYSANNTTPEQGQQCLSDSDKVNIRNLYDTLFGPYRNSVECDHMNRSNDYE